MIIPRCEIIVFVYHHWYQVVIHFVSTGSPLSTRTMWSLNSVRWILYNVIIIIIKSNGQHSQLIAKQVNANWKSQCGTAKPDYFGKSSWFWETWVSFSLPLKWEFALGYPPCSVAVGGRKGRLLFWDLLHPPLLSSVPSPWLRQKSLSQGWGLESEHSSSLTTKPFLILEGRSGVDLVSTLRLKNI